MTIQLRLYTINRDCLEQFAKEWKTKILPLRRAHGFEIRQAWTIVRSNQFAWIISYDGVETWQAQENAYYNSLERRQMNPDPARLIARTEEFEIENIL